MKRLLQHLIAAGLGILSAIYLLNPGAGAIEFIPDLTPLIGNLDEATALLILIRCLAHFGIDLSFLTRIVRPDKKNAQAAPERPASASRAREKTVIDV